MSDKITEFFDIEDVLPAPAQGALCIEYRENDEIVKNLLDEITDWEVTKVIEAERESDKITEFFDIEDVVPAPAQGALCIEYRENDEIVKNLLDEITDWEVTKVIEAEREFSKIFDGGCHTPIGCSGKIVEENGEKFIELFGMYSMNGKVYKRKMFGKLKIFDGGCHTPIGCSGKIVEENGEKFIELFGMYSMNGKVYKRKMFGKLDKNIMVARLLASLLKGDIDG